MNLRLDLALAIGKLVGKLGQHGAVHQNALMLHRFEHRNERPLQRFINRDLAFLQQARLQQFPQAKRDIRIFRRIGRGPVKRHLRKRDQGFAGARHVLEADRLVAQMLHRHFIHAMAVLAGLDGVGNQHGVIDGADIGAVAPQHLQVIFQVLADFQNAGIFEQRLQMRNGIFNFDLAGDLFGAKQSAAFGFLMVERNVAGLAGQG